MINQEQLQGNWQQLEGIVKKKWGKLTDNDLLESEGKREKLIGKITERYGIQKQKAEKQLDKFLKRFDGAGYDISLANKASHMAKELNTKAHHAAEQCQTYAKANPFKALGSAMLAGAIVGLLLKRK